MEDIENKLLRMKLRRERRIHDLLRYKVHWWEDLLIILLVIGLLTWIGTTNAGLYSLSYPLLVVISWFSAKIKKLHQRVDALYEILDNKIEERFASNLKGEDEDVISTDENSPHSP